MKKWIETLIEEKQINTGECFKIETAKQHHFMPLQLVVENILSAPHSEQKQIKKMLIKIDFMGGDILDYFKHLARVLVRNYESNDVEGGC